MNTLDFWKVRSSPLVSLTLLSDVAEDVEWSKEETDYLFNIVHEYDARWFIINDRYEYPGGASHTLEVCFPILC